LQKTAKDIIFKLQGERMQALILEKYEAAMQEAAEE
jgi:hypothetical protein